MNQCPTYTSWLHKAEIISPVRNSADKQVEHICAMLGPMLRADANLKNLAGLQHSSEHKFYGVLVLHYGKEQHVYKDKEFFGAFECEKMKALTHLLGCAMRRANLVEFRTMLHRNGPITVRLHDTDLEEE